MFESLWFHDNNADRICWCIDANHLSSLEKGVLTSREQFPVDSRIDQLFNKYSSHKDKIRWSLKPIIIEHLLHTYDKVVYVDNDIYFFSSPIIIWNQLDEYDILLTPHHYPRSPKKNQNWLEANFKVGLYNAGFVAANKNAMNALKWWANCCFYRCEKSWFRGLFDDQKYLDLMPIVHPNTKVLKHQGCNVAGWNVDVCRRIARPDRTVLINNKWPIVFVHFNGFSVRSIIHGHDVLLKPYLERYVHSLRKLKPNLELDELWNENTLWDRSKLWVWQILDRFRK